MYTKGVVVAKDMLKAKKLFGKACRGGNNIGCINYKKIAF